MRCPFENLYNKFEELTNTLEWDRLQKDFNNADCVYMIGNGGNMAISSHAAADATRLSGKKTYALDSQSLLTSIANDFGYENIFKRWLELYALGSKDTKSLVIGYSGSGGSKNVISALSWAKDQYNFSSHLMSGQKSTCLPDGVNELVCETQYFHTHEIMCVMSFYELVYGSGNKCPIIKDEIIRKMVH